MRTHLLAAVPVLRDLAAVRPVRLEHLRDTRGERSASGAVRKCRVEELALPTRAIQLLGKVLSTR